MRLRSVLTMTSAALVLAACSGGDDADSKDDSEPEPTSPFTGERLGDGWPDNAPFVVKIDNTEDGGPQIGLDRADLVVEETVEGGATRLAGVFYSDLPDEVGHVRSMRATDIGIAKPASAHLVASGAAPQTLDRLEDAQVPVITEDGGGEAFSRQDDKAAPYNVIVNLAEAAEGIDAAKPGEPYLPFAEGEDDATTPQEKASAASVRFSNFHTTEWTKGDDGWSRTDGLADPEFTADHLLVLFAEEKDAGYTDPGGNPVPETDFVGKGRAVTFTADGVVEGVWTKEDYGSPIVLRDGEDRPITLAPGKTWIELVNESTGDVSWN